MVERRVVWCEANVVELECLDIFECVPPFRRGRELVVVLQERHHEGCEYSDPSTTKGKEKRALTDMSIP